MHLAHQSISSDSIKFTTEWNLHPWEFRTIPQELLESFLRNGVIHPPLVMADSAKTFVVVSGVRRLEFFKKHIGPSQIDCMVIGPDTSPSVILNLILTDQTCATTLSLAEKARFVEIASGFLKTEDIISGFQDKLHLPKGRAIIQNLRKILHQDEVFIKAIHAGRIQDRMTAELLSLPEEADRLALIELFRNLGLGDGKQKKIFTQLRDIAYRRGATVAAYLQKKEIVDILDHQEMNIPQKIQHLGSLLQHEIGPAALLAEEVFANKVKSLHLPANYLISHSPAFEKDETVLSITFEDFAACEQYLRKQQCGTE